MPAFAAAIPLIATGIGVGYDAYKSHKASAEAKKLQAPALGLARQQAAQGTSLFNFGMPLLKQAQDYYGRILTGDRGSISATLAPEIGAIGDVYRGAERNLTRSGVTGANRDVAEAELGRERAGKIAGLIPLARRDAASAVANLGQVGVSGGQSGTVNAGNSFFNLLQGQLAQNQLGYAQSQTFGENLGKILVDFYRTYNQRQTSAYGRKYAAASIF